MAQSKDIAIKMQYISDDGNFVTTKDINEATGIWVYRNDAPKSSWNKTLKSITRKLEGQFQAYEGESYEDKQLFLKDQRMSVDDLLSNFE